MRNVHDGMRGKIFVGVRIAPIQRDGPCHLRMKHFFGDVALSLRILGTEGETMPGKEGMFGEITSTPTWIKKRQGGPNVIVQGSSAVHGLVLMEGMKCLIPKGLGRVTDNKGTELGAVLEGDGMRMSRKVKRETNGVVGGLRREVCTWIEPVNECHPDRKTEMTRMSWVGGGEKVERKRIIALRMGRKFPVLC